ncbi:MAG: isoprenylcysteine carboxylmethyltransferase family protein [Proteobacteria bacterium]|nr:isoprenylcysteine carboxylmethyltransferase family protein [Pseudomonadota bacterium]
MNSHQPGPLQDEESQRRISEMSLIEIGEKLFQWRDYIAVPILIVILLASNPTARTATIGTLAMLFGQMIRVYTISFLGVEGATRDGQTDIVITHGPYALVRNPLYLGTLIIILGVLIYAGAPVLGFLALVYFLFQYHCIAKYEETLLLAKFGDEYQRYMELVPAWIPDKVPVQEDFPVPPSFMVALRSEKKSILTVGVVLFLLMLSAH